MKGNLITIYRFNMQLNLYQPLFSDIISTDMVIKIQNWFKNKQQYKDFYKVVINTVDKHTFEYFTVIPNIVDFLNDTN